MGTFRSVQQLSLVVGEEQSDGAGFITDAKHGEDIARRGHIVERSQLFLQRFHHADEMLVLAPLALAIE